MWIRENADLEWHNFEPHNELLKPFQGVNVQTIQGLAVPGAAPNYCVTRPIVILEALSFLAG